LRFEAQRPEAAVSDTIVWPPGSVKAAALEADDVEITIIFRVLGAGEIEEVGSPNVRAPLAQSGLIRSAGKLLDCALVLNSQQ
jgi:hypothetical protein